MKSISRVTIVLIVSITLYGCFWSKDETKPTITVQHKTICIDPPKTTRVFMREVEPTATKDDLEIWWVGVTPKHYENLSQNIDDIFAAIKQKNATIDYYKKCIAGNPDDLKKDNK